MTTNTAASSAPPESLPNPLDTWRQFITDSERQWNGFFREVLGTDAFSNSLNAWVEASLTVQRMIADQLERLYTAFNIPTHGDLVNLGDRMRAVEEALVRLELAVNASAPVTRGTPAARPRPARTKRPVTAGRNNNSG